MALFCSSWDDTDIASYSHCQTILLVNIIFRHRLACIQVVPHTLPHPAIRVLTCLNVKSVCRRFDLCSKLSQTCVLYTSVMLYCAASVDY